MEHGRFSLGSHVSDYYIRSPTDMHSHRAFPRRIRHAEQCASGSSRSVSETHSWSHVCKTPRFHHSALLERCSAAAPVNMVYPAPMPLAPPQAETNQSRLVSVCLLSTIVGNEPGCEARAGSVLIVGPGKPSSLLFHRTPSPFLQSLPASTKQVIFIPQLAACVLQAEQRSSVRRAA